jgi:hypothetical protein
MAGRSKVSFELDFDSHQQDEGKSETRLTCVPQFLKIWSPEVTPTDLKNSDIASSTTATHRHQVNQ